jgi:hypothetical protein
MKKLLFISLAALFLFGCEQANIDFQDSNIEKRLESMVGEKIGAVSNSLKSEGYKKLSFNDQTNFQKGKEAYLLKDVQNTIVSAGYQLNDSVTKVEKLYNEYRLIFSTKPTEKYQAYIYAEHFADFQKAYIDSVKINDNDYAYIYDDPMAFALVLETNKFYLKQASETWYNGEINKDKMWNIQLGETADSQTNKKTKIVAISYSDFSLAQ